LNCLSAGFFQEYIPLFPFGARGSLVQILFRPAERVRGNPEVNILG
jgi:hypothetical protein